MDNKALKELKQDVRIQFDSTKVDASLKVYEKEKYLYFMWGFAPTHAFDQKPHHSPQK